MTIDDVAVDEAVWQEPRFATMPARVLSAYARNARTHDADQVAKIAASMAAQLGMIEAPINVRAVLSN